VAVIKTLPTDLGVIKQVTISFINVTNAHIGKDYIRPEQTDKTHSNKTEDASYRTLSIVLQSNSQLLVNECSMNL